MTWTNVTFEQADAQVYVFADRVFDVVISRFGSMFFADPVTAFANIGDAMRSKGRLVLLTWQELRHNEWLTAIRGALAAGRSLPEPPAGAPGPFGLADPDAVRRTLTAAGFDDVTLDPVKEPLRLGADAADAFGFVSGLGITRGLLNDLGDAARGSVLDMLLAVLAAHETAEGVLFNSSAWLVTARRP
jgi:SAM-dependent methyltransferase